MVKLKRFVGSSVFLKNTAFIKRRTLSVC